MLILLAATFLLITLYILYTKLYYHFYAPNSNSFLQRTRRRRRIRDNAGSFSMDEENRSRVVFHPFWHIPTVGLPPMDIQSIPIHKYGKEMEERDCVVCLAEFEEGDELRVLPRCNHAFHIRCIDTWLSSHTTCPLCRTPIIPPDDHIHNHDHHLKAEDTSSSLTSVEGTIEDNSPAEVLSIAITSGEEVRHNMEDDDHIENTQNKAQENLGEVDEEGCSQRWSLERGAANLLSRSLSCSGKIFSSRSNLRPSPNS
ncbi:RING-H2 finger protein ATL54 [Bienertia sinuspersici]